MAKGNTILFKGERNTGKTSLAVDVIEKFLEESPEHKVVYVGMSQQGKDIQTEVNHPNLMTIGVTDESYAQFVLGPQLALRVAA